jgi:hypothetical protein
MSWGKGGDFGGWALYVTTLARTLLDLADALSTQALKRTIHEAEYQRLLDTTSLTAVVNDNPGRHGRRILNAAASPAELTRSELEQRFLEMVSRRGLPRPRATACATATSPGPASAPSG